jgi:hypothetical protein
MTGEEYFPGSRIPWHEMRPIMVPNPLDRGGFRETEAWMDKASSKLTEAHAENARLRWALQWYAGHLANSRKPNWEGEGAKTALERDAGAHARAALQPEKADD